jgi:hypothetical protein
MQFTISWAFATEKELPMANRVVRVTYLDVPAKRKFDQVYIESLFRHLAKYLPGFVKKSRTTGQSGLARSRIIVCFRVFEENHGNP